LTRTSAAVGGIAVVIPSYNRKHLVLEALNSVTSQVLLPDRVILVDDGSNDGTQQAVSHWSKSNEPPFELVYIYQQNAGPGAARNLGIESAKDCEWVAFLDSDDLWHKEHLCKLTEAVLKQPDAIAASNELEEKYYSTNGSLISSRAYVFPEKLLSGCITGPDALRITGPLTPATMIRRDALLKAGGFNTRLKYSEDKLLFLIVSTMGPWCRVAGFPVIYRNFVRNDQARLSGTKQLSDKPHQSSRIYYARLLDNAIGHFAYSNNKYHIGVRWALWKAWYRAGRHLEKTKHYKLAVYYYQKAAGYRLFSKAIPRMCIAKLKSLYLRLF
jgi:glycosyltransferase involved in cell wall biosynthesis